MTTLLPVPFHPRATDADVIASIAEYFRDAKSAAVPAAWRIIVERLSEVYGTRIVDRAVHQYMRALQQEQRSLKRQVARAKADWLKRQ